MPFAAESGYLRLLEPLDAPISPLCERLLDGTYDKPFIIEHDRQRYLHFGITYVQSAMRIDEPHALDLRYTQKMMGFLLFTRDPRRVVLLGLGGGSLAKFCYRALQETSILAVEIDPNVIALRRYFAIPEDDDRFRVIQGDAAEFVAHVTDPICVLLVDAFNEQGMAPSIADRRFLSHAHASLGPAGILVMNLAGRRADYADMVEDVRDIFDHQVILLSVEDDYNHILFAFKQPEFEPDWRELRWRARSIKAQCGLDFPGFVRKMELAARNAIVG